MIDSGLPLDARTSTGKTILHACARPSRGFANVTTAEAAVQIVNAVFIKDTNLFENLIDLKDDDGTTSLSLAVNLYVEHPTLVDFLLACSADPLVVDNLKRAPIHLACVRNHVHCATSLINNFANVDAEDGNGRTPLLISAIQGSVPLVFLLLQHGARYDISDSYGWLPLSYSLMPLKLEPALDDSPDDDQPDERDDLDDDSYHVGSNIFRDKAKLAEKYADMSRTYDNRVIHAIAAVDRAVAAAAPAAVSDDSAKKRHSSFSLGSALFGSDAVTALGSALFGSDAVAAVKPTNVDPAVADAIKARDEAIRVARDSLRKLRPSNKSRYEIIAMALLKKENHLDAAIEDDIELFKESLERHFDLNRAELVRAFYDPTDGFSNELFRDPLLQRAIDLHWTSKVRKCASVQMCMCVCVCVCVLCCV